MPEYRKILLLKVPYCAHPDTLADDENFRTKSTFRPVPSLALASLYAFVEKYKTFTYELKALDVNLEAYQEPGLPVDPAAYPELLERAIRENDYDVLALSAMFVFNVRWVEDAVRHCRRYHPAAKIIIGGGYPTLFPERSLARHAIDDAVLGEGEATFLHILNRYNQHRDQAFEEMFPFDGYASKDASGRVMVHNGRKHFIDLALLPLPAWQALDIERYFTMSGERVMPIQGSRGCPYTCTYCSTYVAWGRRIRYKPVQNVIAEIEDLNRRYGNPTLYFSDDNLSFSKPWIMEFLQTLLAKGLTMDATVSNFSVKHLDEEIIALLKQAGVREFGIAVESGSPAMQKKIRKNINFDKVRQVIQIMKKHDLHCHACWMVGFPNETLDQIRMTFDLAKELRAHSNQFLSVLPYPGTDLFEEARAGNLLIFDDEDLDKFDYRKSEYLRSDQWTYPQLQEMIYDANIQTNFLNCPSLETPSGRDHLLEFLETLLRRLPDHVVAHVVVGHIYKRKGDGLQSGQHFQRAHELLRKPSLRETFQKYLAWNYPAINDYNEYFQTVGVE
ncbi:MAG: radical SAM protein [Desulfarculus sp.]|nr:radical SAM protein [Desulfarculus sp.]